MINVNSTAVGGGVAEMLQTLLAYARGAGRRPWLVIEGNPEFFAVTKRIHNGLYGTPGDGGGLGPRSARSTRRRCARTPPTCARWSAPATSSSCTIRSPRGSRAAAARRGAVIWRCHVGIDHANVHANEPGTSCGPTSSDVAASCSRASVRAAVVADRRELLPSPLDRPVLGQERADRSRTRHRLLRYVGLLDGDGAARAVRSRAGRIDRPGQPPRRLLQTGPPPPADAPLVSRSRAGTR